VYGLVQDPICKHLFRVYVMWSLFRQGRQKSSSGIKREFACCLEALELHLMARASTRFYVILHI